MALQTKYRGRVQEVPSKAIDRFLERLTPRNFDHALRFVELEMRKYLTAVVDALTERHGKPWSSSRIGADTLSKRSGKGLASLRNFMVRRSANDVTGHVRLNRYMMMHETGGTIRAKNAKYLTIPLPAALNADGTPKKRRARDWNNTFVIKGKKRGTLVIMQKVGRGAVPLYALKKRVRIPRRLGLAKELRSKRPAFRRTVLDRIMEMARGQQRTNRRRRL